MTRPDAIADIQVMLDRGDSAEAIQRWCEDVFGDLDFDWSGMSGVPDFGKIKNLLEARANKPSLRRFAPPVSPPVVPGMPVILLPDMSIVREKIVQELPTISVNKSDTHNYEIDEVNAESGNGTPAYFHGGSYIIHRLRAKQLGTANHAARFVGGNRALVEIESIDDPEGNLNDSLKITNKARAASASNPAQSAPPTENMTFKFVGGPNDWIRGGVSLKAQNEASASLAVLRNNQFIDFAIKMHANQTTAFRFCATDSVCSGRWRWDIRSCTKKPTLFSNESYGGVVPGPLWLTCESVEVVRNAGQAYELFDGPNIVNHIVSVKD